MFEAGGKLSAVSWVRIKYSWLRNDTWFPHPCRIPDGEVAEVVFPSGTRVDTDDLVLALTPAA